MPYPSRPVIDRYRRAFADLPPRVWCLAAVMLVNRSGAMVMIFLTLYLTERLGWTNAQAGQAIAVYGFGACIGSFLGGRWTARLGAQAVQATSLLGTAIGYVILSWMRDGASILSVLFVTSIASESFRPANAMAISESCGGAQLSRAFALNRLAANLGFTFGPAIGGMLASYSYTALFHADAASCLIAMIVLERYGRSFGSEISAGSDDSEPHGTARISDRRFWCFALWNGVLSLVFFQLLSTYPLCLKNEFHLSEFQIGSLMAVNTILIVLFEMPLVDSLRRFKSIQCVAIGAFLICEGFGLLAMGHDYLWAIAVVLTWTIGEMISMPFILTYIAETSSSSERSRRLGTHGVVMSGGFVVAPLLGTWCYESDPRLLWWMILGVGPLVAAGFWLTGRVDVSSRPTLASPTTPSQ
ncbi:MAG: MFS transporter [Planctomycetota bacterium]